MKVLLAVAFVVCFTVVVNGCTTGGFQASSGSNCTQYDRCVNGNWSGPNNCSEGTFFNNDISACAYSYDVDTLTCANVTNVTVITGCQPGQNRASAGTGCAQYEMCAHGSWVGPVPCAGGTLFDNDWGRCNYAAKINTTSCTEFPYSSECNSGRYRAAPSSNCSQYNFCLWNKWLGPFPCPGGTLFNNDFNKCSYPADIDTATCDRIETRNCIGVSVYRVPTPGSNCTQFDFCVHQRWMGPFDCAPGTLWNIDEDACTQAAGVNSTCQYASGGGGAISDGPCNAAPGMKLYGQVDTGCQMFAPCKGGDNITCYSNTLFANSLQRCVRAKIVNVNDCSIKTNQACNATEPEMRGLAGCTSYQVCNSEGFWADRSNCGGGFLINLDKRYCDYPSNVHASNCTEIM